MTVKQKLAQCQCKCPNKEKSDAVAVWEGESILYYFCSQCVASIF